MICPENFLYVCEDNDMSGKVPLCPFEPLENAPPPTFDASYAPEYIVNLSLQSVKTDLHRAHKRQDKSRLFHISDHDLVATFVYNQMVPGLLRKFLQI